MNGLILITAMTATGGLFGGKCALPVRGHHAQNVCVGGGCGTATQYAPTVVPYAAQTAQYAPTPVQYAPAPQQAYYPSATPAPAPAATVSYQSFYSVGTACATGNCPRR